MTALPPAGGLVDVPGILVGEMTDPVAQTGVTVVRFTERAVCGVDVRGSAPGTRETDLLAPTATVERVDAIALCGGSAFGLAAADGVMRWHEERGYGFAVGPWRVPIVPAAVIFDLFTGNGTVRPDAAMGYRAADAATHAPVREGRTGAGTGALVGKLGGIEHAAPGGTGSASTSVAGGLVVAALAIVNALGSVYEPLTRRRLAGPSDQRGHALDDVALLLERDRAGTAGDAGANTTLAVVVTNAALTRVQCTKVAQMAHDGIALAVAPVHLSGDGDTVFAAATGTLPASVDLVGTLAAQCVAHAIARAVQIAAT